MVMKLAQELKIKYEEMADLYSRGLLTVYYITAWEDVIKIVDKYTSHKEEPIMLLADRSRVQLRMWTQNHIDWAASIRPPSKYLKTEIITGGGYYEVEFKVRTFLKKLSEKKVNFDPQDPKNSGK